MHDDEDDIPLLEDILRPGDTPPAAPRSTSPPNEVPASNDQPAGPTLTDEEIEAIAHRVVERHTARIEEAVARAIRKALEIKAGTSDSSGREDRHHERTASSDTDSDDSNW